MNCWATINRPSGTENIWKTLTDLRQFVSLAPWPRKQLVRFVAIGESLGDRVPLQGLAHLAHSRTMLTRWQSVLARCPYSISALQRLRVLMHWAQFSMW